MLTNNEISAIMLSQNNKEVNILKSFIETKTSAEQLIKLLKQLSESQQAYISGYTQALADSQEISIKGGKTR